MRLDGNRGSRDQLPCGEDGFVVFSVSESPGHGIENGAERMPSPRPKPGGSSSEVIFTTVPSTLAADSLAYCEVDIGEEEGVAGVPGQLWSFAAAFSGVVETETFGAFSRLATCLNRDLGELQETHWASV